MIASTLFERLFRRHALAGRLTDNEAPTDMADFTYAIEDFSGRARLFPVPKLVMFPHVMQPLHIFEPRYRDMVADAMEGDRLIAMPIFSPGWDEDYMGRPEVEPIACLGKIVSHQKLPDGRSNILLMGLHRITLLEELPPSNLYREAIAEPLPDCYPAKDKVLREQLHGELLEQFRTTLSGEINKLSCLEDFLRSNISLAVLTDIVAKSLPGNSVY